MTHTLSQLRKLNAERTQGDYRWGDEFEASGGRYTWSLLAGNGYGVLSCDGEGNSPYEYDRDFIAAMPDAMKLLEKYHEALVSVVAEAKEHWPDAESWQIIEEITALLEESND